MIHRNQIMLLMLLATASGSLIVAMHEGKAPEPVAGKTVHTREVTVAEQNAVAAHETAATATHDASQTMEKAANQTNGLAKPAAISIKLTAKQEETTQIQATSLKEGTQEARDEYIKKNAKSTYPVTQRTVELLRQDISKSASITPTPVLEPADKSLDFNADPVSAEPAAKPGLMLGEAAKSDAHVTEQTAIVATQVQTSHSAQSAAKSDATPAAKLGADGKPRTTLEYLRQRPGKILNRLTGKSAAKSTGKPALAKPAATSIKLTPEQEAKAQTEATGLIEQNDSKESTWKYIQENADSTVPETQRVVELLKQDNKTPAQTWAKNFKESSSKDAIERYIKDNAESSDPTIQARIKFLKQ